MMQPKNKRPKQGVCSVCELTKNDTTTKMVYWCNFCKAWICAQCSNAPVQRVKAAAKKVINKFCKACNK
jgi:hypothetical protein